MHVQVPWIPCWQDLIVKEVMEILSQVTKSSRENMADMTVVMQVLEKW